MKIRYFTDMDTLYIALKENGIAEPTVPGGSTIADLDNDGNICAITIEHTSK